MSKKLYFRYGAMNSGKSTAIFIAAHNYTFRDQKVIVAKPTVDTKDTKVQSRTGVVWEVGLHIEPEQDIHAAFSEMQAQEKKAGSKIDCLIVDEAQFLSVKQVNQLFRIAMECDVPVMAYGLRTDFQGNPFPGAARLLQLAHTIEELKTICRCGSKAIFNARIIDGKFTSEGEQVAIDGQQVDYESLCGKCYVTKVGPLDW